VNPSVGSALYCAAKAESREIKTASDFRRYVKPVRMKIKSALLSSSVSPIDSRRADVQNPITYYVTYCAKAEMSAHPLEKEVKYDGGKAYRTMPAVAGATCPKV